MNLERELALHALERHPDRAATMLERLDETEVIRLLDKGRLESATAIVERLSPHYATAALSGVKPDRAAQIVGALPIDTAVRLVRRVKSDVQEAILERVDPDRAKNIRAVLRFREGSAGAMMDPTVLALPSELSAREALGRVRKGASLARYNLYVVDQSDRLVGAINLRELLLARNNTLLTELMTRDPHRLIATADRSAVVAHPGWKSVHALPVVDETGAFLGAIRYRVLRRLEDEMIASRTSDVETSEALGQLIAVGARALIECFSGTATRESGRETRGTEEGS